MSHSLLNHQLRCILLCVVDAAVSIDAHSVRESGSLDEVLMELADQLTDTGSAYLYL